MSDPLKPEFYRQWVQIAQKNSSVYDELDGATSLYRCDSVAQFKQAMDGHSLRSFLDPEVQTSVSEIRGFLVDWPKNLFRHDDLSPSMATRALIPDDLWV